MKQQSFIIGLGLAAVTSLATISLPPIFSQSTAAELPSDKVTFFCKSTLDETSNKQIPATFAWNPEKGVNVLFIGWKSEFFSKSGWTPIERCQKVTQKFQAFNEQGRLNFFTSGTVKGYPVICGVSNQGETCNADNLLFTLKTGSQSDYVMKRLMDLGTNTVADPQQQKILLQSSDGQLVSAQ